MRKSHDLGLPPFGFCSSRAAPRCPSGQSGAAWQRREMAGAGGMWHVPPPPPRSPGVSQARLRQGMERRCLGCSVWREMRRDEPRARPPGRRHYEGPIPHRAVPRLSSRGGRCVPAQQMRSRAPARGEGSRGRAWCPPGREPPALHPAAPGGQRPPSLPTRGKEPCPGPGAARRRGARRHFSPMLWSFDGKRPWSEAEWSCVCARVCAQACAYELVRARTRTRSFSPSAEGRVARPDALRSPPARPACVPCISSTSRGGLGTAPQ